MGSDALHDIRGPVALPMDLWAILLMIVLVTGVIGAGIFLLMRWRRQSAFVPPVPVTPPWEKALLALSRLEAAPCQGDAAVKEYYVQLSSIVRGYIEERFLIRAPEMTTEEFMQKAAGSSVLVEEHKTFLQRFLDGCDLVKFAGQSPAPADRVEAVRLARRFVERTVPQVPESGEAS